MAWTVTSATQLTTVSSEAVFQASGVDWKIALLPGEIAHCQVKTASSDTTDESKIIVYTTSLNSPGAVPDAAQNLSGSDWGIYTAFVINNVDTAEGDDCWQYFSVAGVRTFAVTAQRNPGDSTDTFTCDLSVATDGVNAG